MSHDPGTAEGAVTVVVPSKDRPALLAVTLASVLRQRGVELVVVVVDDGGDVPAASVGVQDARVTFLRHERSRGVAAARNTGLETARTPWVAFVDDDDLWAPDKLAHQLQALRRDPACRWACSTAAPFYDDDGSLGRLHRPPVSADVSVALLRANVVPGGGSGVLASTALVREVGGFDTRLSNLADWDCWLRLGQRSPLARVQFPDVGYRRHGSSMGHAVARSEVELAKLREWHAALYERAGVEVDTEAWRAYLNQLIYESGQWRDGVRGSWDLLRAYQHRRALLQPLRYAVPHLSKRAHERLRTLRDPRGYAYARRWLHGARTGRPESPEPPGLGDTDDGAADGRGA